MASLLDGRAVEVNLQSGISSVSADPEVLGLALRQIIGNAIKYSPAGSKIEISGTEGDARVTIAVRDEGQGRSPVELSTCRTAGD
jgi:signal transduction histidine kinase